MSGIGGNHPNGEELGQYGHYNQYFPIYQALQMTGALKGQSANLGTHHCNETKGESGSNVMGPGETLSQPQNMYVQQSDQPYISMIPTVRALECLAWQLLYGSNSVVFEENRWQECFQVFNTLAMQSTSLITTLSQRYEEKQMYESAARALINTFHMNHSNQEVGNGAKIYSQVQLNTASPVERFPTGINMSKGDGKVVPAQKQPGKKAAAKKRPQKVAKPNSKENSKVQNVDNTDHGSEKVDDEQLAWNLHLELNTKSRAGKPKPTKLKLSKTISLPDAGKVPESQSRRKQSRKNIRRSL